MAAPYYKVKEQFRCFAIKVSEKNRDEILNRIKSRYKKGDIGKVLFLSPAGIVIIGWYGPKGAYEFTKNLSGANFRGFNNVAAATAWLNPEERIVKEEAVASSTTELPPWQ